MQTFVKIGIVWLLFSYASGWCFPTSFSKGPVAVVNYNETNSTKAATYTLVESNNNNELQLFALNQTSSGGYSNMSDYHLNIFIKSIDSINLSVGGNVTGLSYVGPALHFGKHKIFDPDLIAHGFIIALKSDNETGIPTVRVYQQPLDGGAAVGRFRIDNNLNVTFYPRALYAAFIGKTLYVFYEAAASMVNLTSFTIGSSVNDGTLIQHTVTTTYHHGYGSIFKCVWNEALGND
mgnify:FL=1